MRTVSELAQVIRSEGHRVTRSRLAVLRVLATAEGALDAATIYRLGRREHPRLGRVSVYRTLDLLTDLGLARQIHGDGGCHSYARADRSEGHYLVCQNCGQVSEFPCTGLDQLLDAVARQSGFLVCGHMLQLEGLCPACRPS
jgi:Fur family ferric uptake transcriptional regulator